MTSYGTIAAALMISAYVIFTVIYSVRERRRWRAERLRREMSPIEDQITARFAIIRAAAADTIKNLQEWDPPGSREESDWIVPLLDYFYRLEALASSSSHVINDWEQLAAEGEAFIDQGLKGFIGVKSATAMVTLLRKRDEV